jgi:hypothetical protein
MAASSDDRQPSPGMMRRGASEPHAGRAATVAGMRPLAASALSLLAACTPPVGGDDDDVVDDDDSAADDDDVADDDDGSDDDDATVDPALLNGTVPANAIDLPDFLATDSSGAPRTPDDLRGHSTVMWFFPFAGTPT